jgi:branched-chain amino acid transport system permease protein
MTNASTNVLWVLLPLGIAAPFLFPDYSNQIAVLWLMIVFASTWDILGGQMGYNSLGNIFFFGAGMYIAAVVQIGLFYDVAMYTSGARTTHIDFTDAQYFTGLFSGFVVAGIASAALAIVAGWIVFGLRGPYFAIGTLGLAIAAAELIASWEFVGAAAGISMPVFPGDPHVQKLFFYYLLFALAYGLLIFLRWLYSTNFGLALNAIRDDEEKAEAMGLHTKRYKRVAWAISAFFLGISGAVFGNMTGFIEPRDIAFPTTTFNIFMVLMVLLGGKGTLWGPVIGAVVFHVIKEVTWTYFLGWQFIALGLLIIITIVYFQQGIAGWLIEKFPQRFGNKAQREAKTTAAAEPAGKLAPQPEGAE